METISGNWPCFERGTSIITFIMCLLASSVSLISLFALKLVRNLKTHETISKFQFFFSHGAALQFDILYIFSCWYCVGYFNTWSLSATIEILSLNWSCMPEAMQVILDCQSLQVSFLFWKSGFRSEIVKVKTNTNLTRQSFYASQTFNARKRKKCLRETPPLSISIQYLVDNSLSIM